MTTEEFILYFSIGGAIGMFFHVIYYWYIKRKSEEANQVMVDITEEFLDSSENRIEEIFGECTCDDENEINCAYHIYGDRIRGVCMESWQYGKVAAYLWCDKIKVLK